MKINVKQGPKVICSNSHGMHRYFGWPTVARLQDGSLMMAASGFRIAHICPFGKVVVCRSFDEGKSWSAPEVVLDTPLDDRDAGVLPFGESGVIVTSFNNTPAFQRSRCQAMNEYANAYLDEVERRGDWEQYLGSSMVISHDGGKTFSSPIRVPISSPHGPCQLQDGRVLYVGRYFQKEEDEPYLACYEISPDGAATLLSRIEDIAPDLLSCEPHAVQLPNGRIVVHIRVQTLGSSSVSGSFFTVFQSVSDDGGKSFSKPVQLLSDHGGSPAHLLLRSSGVLISTYGYRTAPFGIRAMFSYDNGETWETDQILADAEPTADLGYPASVELENGDVLTVFYSCTHQGGPAVIKQIVWSLEDTDR